MKVCVSLVHFMQNFIQWKIQKLYQTNVGKLFYISVWADTNVIIQVAIEHTVR